MSPANEIRHISPYILTGALILLLSPLVSSSIVAGQGTTGGAVLNIPVYSRGSALSGVGVAIAGGTGALHSNPAGIGNGPSELAFTHGQLLQDLTLNNISACWRIGARTGIGLGVTYVGYGDIQGYSPDALPTGEIDAYSVVASIGLSHQITPAIAVGLTAKPVHEKLAYISAGTVTFDLGFLANLGPIALGAEYANVGGSLRFLNESVNLPATMHIGAAFTTPLTGYTFAASVKRVGGSRLIVNGGAEYAYNSLLAIRAGYGSTLGEETSALDGLSAGLGLRIQMVRLDYSYHPSGTEEGIHQITAAYIIGP